MFAASSSSVKLKSAHCLYVVTGFLNVCVQVLFENQFHMDVVLYDIKQ